MLNQPRKSKSQEQLEILLQRMPLSSEEQQQLSRLKTGHKGELLFFNLLSEQLGSDVTTLFDFFLHLNGSVCQIDCLLLFQTKAFLFEVKHFAGNYFIQNNNWYTSKQSEIKNPLHQLKRTELLLSTLIKKHHMQIELQSFVVFTHPEFFLYEAPRNLPLIFPAQLNRFLKSLQNLPRRLGKSHQDFIAEVLSHQTYDNPSRQEVKFNFGRLKKGILCESCNGFMISHNASEMFCDTCQKHEPIEISIKRSIKEYRVLFPDDKITVKQIAEWIDHQASNYYIRKVLAEGWMVIGKYRHTYYLPRK